MFAKFDFFGDFACAACSGPNRRRIGSSGRESAKWPRNWHNRVNKCEKLIRRNTSSQCADRPARAGRQQPAIDSDSIFENSHAMRILAGHSQMEEYSAD